MLLCAPAQETPAGWIPWMGGQQSAATPRAHRARESHGARLGRYLERAIELFDELLAKPSSCLVPRGCLVKLLARSLVEPKFHGLAPTVPQASGDTRPGLCPWRDLGGATHNAFDAALDLGHPCVGRVGICPIVKAGDQLARKMGALA